MIIVRVPFRISFVGGGSDYPEWFHRHAGMVISATIDKYCYVSIRRLRNVHDYNYRLVYSKIEEVKELADIQHPTARAALQYYGNGGRYEIHHDADLPAGTGMGSSSAFTVGLIHGLHAISSAPAITSEELARRAYFIEREIVKECVGAQDQYAAAHGGLNNMQFCYKGVFPEKIQMLYPENLEKSTMLFYTHTRRSAPKIAATYFEDIAAKDKIFAQLVYLAKNAERALTANNLPAFGRYVGLGWDMKSKLSKAVSSDDFDRLLRIGMEAGADGCKMLGAGGGGFLMFIVWDAGNRDKVLVAMKKEGLAYVPVRFTDKGSEIVFSDEN